VTNITASSSRIVHNPRLPVLVLRFNEWPPTRRDAIFHGIAAATDRHTEHERS
jgi:hypothetical protein